MPETHFKVQWPDGSQDTCYSPSSVVKKYFELNRDYELADFVALAETALNMASDRVRAKYGMGCGLAMGQLADIQVKAEKFKIQSRSIVRIIEFTN
jgi:uncharacterized repeat protein (TIGR04042 family)